MHMKPHKTRYKVVIKAGHDATVSTVMENDILTYLMFTYHMLIYLWAYVKYQLIWLQLTADRAEVADALFYSYAHKYMSVCHLCSNTFAHILMSIQYG